MGKLINEKIQDWQDCAYRCYNGENQSPEILIKAMISDLKEIESALQQTKPVTSNDWDQMELEDLLSEFYLEALPLDDIPVGKYARKIIELVTPAPIEVPEFVGEFIKKSNGLGLTKMETLSTGINFVLSVPSDEFSEWVNENEDTFIDAVLNGYTVAKEPEWIVKTPKNNYFLVFGNDESSFKDSVPHGAITDKQHARKFKDKTKAEAVATLIGGEVVPVEEEE